MDTKEFLKISKRLIQNPELITEILKKLCDITIETQNPNEIGTRIIKYVYRKYKELYPEISDCYFMAKEFKNQRKVIQLPFLFKGQRYLFIIEDDLISLAKTRDLKYNQPIYSNQRLNLN